MKNIYTFLLVFSMSIAAIGQTQLGLVEAASGPQELTLQTDLDADYNGQTIAGIFFIVKMEIPTTDPNFNGFSSPIPALNSGWIATGVDDDGTDRYYMFQNNNAFVAPAGWTAAGGIQDIVSFNLNGGTLDEVRDVSLAANTDVVADGLIDAVFGFGASTAVYGSDIIDQFGAPTVTGYFAETVNSVILPIELLNLTVARGNDEISTEIDWTTATEVNGSHFDVERSQDGRTWTTVGTVEAVGESTSIQNYHFTDNDLPLSKREATKDFYYRLNMLDNDGSQVYSDIRKITFDSEDLGQLIVYPNPSVNEVFVSLSSITNETGPAQLNVYSVDGQMVKKVSLTTNDDHTVDISDIQRGAYIFSVVQGTKRYTQQVIKID